MSRAIYCLGALAAIALVAGSCSRGGTQPPPQSAYSYQQTQEGSQTRMGAQPERLKTCPMAVLGTELAVSELPNGIALVFTTDTGNVGDLRSRVHKAAEQYRAQAGYGEQGKREGSSSGQGMMTQEGMGGQSGFGTQGGEGPGVTTPGASSGKASGSEGETAKSGSGSSPGATSGAGMGAGQSGTSGGIAGTDEQMGTSGGAGSGYPRQPPSLEYSQGAAPEKGQRQASAASKVPYNVYAEDIDRGARLVFTPRDPNQLDALRSEIRQHAALMQPGECPPPRISRR